MAMLTNARLSLWDAIDNWPGLASMNAKKFRLDGKVGALGVAPTGMGDLPAIAITPADVRGGWDVNRMMRFDYSLEVSVYANALDDAEGWVEEVWKALYQSCPDGSTASYVHTATGYPPSQLGVKFEVVGIGQGGKTVVVRATILVGLRPQQDVYG